MTTLLVNYLIDTPNAWTTALLPLAVVLALICRLAPQLHTNPSPFTERGASTQSRRGEAPNQPSPQAERADPQSGSGRGFSAARGIMSLLARALVLLLIPTTLAGWVYIDRVHATYDESLHDLAAGRFVDAVSAAAAAADADPRNAAYQINAGVTSAIVYMVDRRGDSAGNVALIDDAISRFRKAVVAEPRSAIGYANLALALRLRADRQIGASREATLGEAADAASEAIVRAPTDAVIASVAGTIFETAKQNEDAASAYARAVSHDAGLVQSPFWNTSAFRIASRNQVVAASALTVCEKGRITVLYAGYRDDLRPLEQQCRTQVEAAPLDARARSDLAVILHGLGRRDDARREAEDAVARVPDSPYARTALAIALMPEGDLEAVRHELLQGAYLGDPDAALLLDYTYEPPAGANPLIANLHPPSGPGPAPEPVADLLKQALDPAAPIVFDGGTQRYLLGVLYYRVRFLRESPTSILVPGEWLTFSSPRALLLLEAIGRHKRLIDAK
jgi:tetratricopeptide (TPR) repeat protein